MIVFKYKGYRGSLEESRENECFPGRLLFIDDIITYEAKTVEGLKVAFEEAVDNYLAFCAERGEQPNRPRHEGLTVRSL